MTPYDVIIVGGSYAGIAAALQLARARRPVLVIDAGQRRNRFVAHAHGFLGQDGRAPSDIHADAKAQLLRYPSVTWLDGTVSSASPGFSVSLCSGEAFSGRRLILASGVVDEVPPIPGLADRWGRSVFSCPYCDGYELDRGRIGVIATHPMAVHHAQLLPDWGPTTFFSNGLVFDETEVTRRGATLDASPVTAVSGHADVHTADGRTLSFAGLFVGPTSRISPLATQLGLVIDTAPTGAPIIHTDEWRSTSLPGVFAAGDTASMAASLSFAVADGARAGIAAHRSLLF
ncbi:MAG TPA: NAD(P)/FAD-dependent oxidoreductase [Kofleriaceae bacterium]|jgi:thioredoxin reductase